MDYKQLLWKYINHVGEWEGVTYVWQAENSPWFSSEEFKALEALEELPRPEPPLR